MLKSTFTHIRGINAEKEKELWRRGILTWEDLEPHLRPHQHSLPFVDERESHEGAILDLSRAALEKSDIDFFASVLDRREHFRIALSFPEDVIFLDIETTGLSQYYDSITMVGWCFGSDYRVFISGDDDSDLRMALSKARILVTFNGTIFDVPFLKKKFANLVVPSVHVDLRFLARRAGFSGGQKVIEELIGLKRAANLQEVDGRAAPLLWHKYRRGDTDALRLLIEYNHADVNGMRSIFDRTVDRLLEEARAPREIRDSLPRFETPVVLEWANGIGRWKNGIKLRPFIGDIRPLTTYTKLFSGPKIKKPRVVGIDLTGSEKRPSGWCLLDGRRASTAMLETDEEIIATTIAAKPDLVSIDSPLSLPAGRTSVFDSDPGREEYGIMRYCERVLKKRGVNVYPALIPSMQRLTARGIQLAQKFRSEGLPVIESYPGAAQDILNIPRKRAGLDLLREGLAEFGISGKFLREPVTHDELDAITSALVGVFFWVGKFEALGDAEEEALVIPDLHIDSGRWRRRVVIGFSGPVAAGKTTIASHLADRGFAYGRYSAVVQELLVGSASTTRKNLQALGKKIHDSKGQRWLGRELLKRLPTAGDLVIDGLRFPEDHAFLVESFGPAFVHVHLTASAKTRKSRFIHREGRGANFNQAENAPVEKNVPKLNKLAQQTIDTDVKPVTAFRRVDKVLQKTTKRN
jgi:uncharacterized protein YprB with RNaseH-like and TPR domain/predicted nuclease with RNAse H fold/dephospho-CoA kinase